MTVCDTLTRQGVTNRYPRKNANFDKNVVLSEFIRNDMDLNNVGEFCTMKNTINYCKITPKVRELSCAAFFTPK